MAADLHFPQPEQRSLLVAHMHFMHECRLTRFFTRRVCNDWRVWKALFVLLRHSNSTQQPLPVKGKASNVSLFLFRHLLHYVSEIPLYVRDVKTKFTTGFISDCKRICAIISGRRRGHPKVMLWLLFFSHSGPVVTKYGTVINSGNCFLCLLRLHNQRNVGVRSDVSIRSDVNIFPSPSSLV